MCDPLTIAGLALTAGSTVANYAANQKIQSARNDALAAERIRQKGFDREAEAVNATSQDRFTNVEGQVQQEATKLGDYFAGQNATAPAADAMPTTTGSNITVQEEARQRSKAKASTDASGRALGQLRSFGDVLGGISRGQARDAGQVAQIGGFKTGSSGVLPYELEAANSKGAGLQMLGDILGGLGSVAVPAGLMGGAMPSFSGIATKLGFGGGGGIPATAALRAGMSNPLRLGHLYGGGR